MIRLRDVSSEAEREYKSKLAEIEKELSSQEELTSEPSDLRRRTLD